MTPTVAMPRGSTTGWQSALQSNEGTHLYRHADFLTDLKILDDINDVLIPNGDDTTGRHIGLRVACAGLSANDATALIRVLLVFKVKINGVDYYSLREYATLTCTAGQMVAPDASNRVANTIVAALGVYGTFLEARTGARAASALTVGTVLEGMAEYQIPDIDNCDGIILDTQIQGSGGSTSTTINPLYAFTT